MKEKAHRIVYASIVNQRLIICIKMIQTEATDCVEEIEWDPLRQQEATYCIIPIVNFNYPGV